MHMIDWSKQNMLFQSICLATRHVYSYVIGWCFHRTLEIFGCYKNNPFSTSPNNYFQVIIEYWMVQNNCFVPSPNNSLAAMNLCAIRRLAAWLILNVMLNLATIKLKKSMKCQFTKAINEGSLNCNHKYIVESMFKSE